ncbi:hypothetical protein ACQ4LE_010536 [Meloidogyne hapla]
MSIKKMNIFIFLLFLFSLSNNSVEATEGLLITQTCVSTFKYFQKILSTNFVIFRALNENEIVEKAVINIVNARTAGIVDIDIYLNTNVSDNPSEAIIKTLDYLDDNNAKFDRVWLLIYTWPGFGQGWSNDKDKNVEIIEEMIITLKERNLTYGIYTAKDYWINITGNTKKFCDSPLFYVNHDGKNNFDDFYKNPFGGWEEPTIKLYGCKATDDASICSLWKPNY